MNFFEAKINGQTFKVLKEKIGNTTWVSFNGWTFKQDLPYGKRLRSAQNRSIGDSSEIISPMPGQLIKLLVKEGDKVKEGQSLAVLEAMKMEHSLKSNINARVESIFFKEKDSLQMNDLIIKLKKED